MSRIRVVVATCVALLAACNGRGGQGDPAARPATEREHAEVTLERTACFGSCPIYTLIIDDTGLVRYEGVAFVEHVGTDSARVAAGRVHEIIAAADELGFFALADSYRMDEPTCPEYFMDAPSVIVSISTSSRAKRVEVDHGCVGFPREVAELARRIDEAAGSDRWVGQR